MWQENSRCETDEISLVDLFLVLMKRKWIVVVLSLLGAVIAISYSSLQRASTSYSTPLEVGTLLISDSKDLITIDSVQNLKAKIEQAYIPLLESKYNRKAQIAVESPRKSNLLILKSVSDNPDQLGYFSELHSEIMALIQKDELARIKEMGATQVSKTRKVSQTRKSKVTSRSQNITLMAMLGAFAGLFMGIFAAFFVEFVASARKELKARKTFTN